MMEVLSVAPECAPLVKTGGLADVAGALPGALAGEGVRIRSLTPGYPPVMGALGGARTVWQEPALFGGAGRVLAAEAGGLDLLVLDAPHLYDRGGGLYLGPDGRDWPDNAERFAALSWAAAALARGGAAGWRPDLVHCHDWQAGLVPAYLRRGGAPVPTVMTVHNVAFQGLVAAERLSALRLDRRDFTPAGLEYHGRISPLKAGLVYADRLTTVSPSYARELLTPEFGMGLDGVLRSRRDALSGILNGIDTGVWDPAADPHVAPYTGPAGKAANRAALLAEFGLAPGEGPLCVVVSRLTGQKGLDLLLEAAPALLARGGRLALLGTGEPALEAAWRTAAAAEPGLAVRVGYDEALAHRMLAGGDAVLVPSRFEPCGLTQLYGLRYATLPVVALTGGLADTVIPANDAGLKAGVATGLQVHPLTAETLAAALGDLCALFAEPPVWRRMQENAMRHPVGWAGSAAQYARLYRSLVAAA